MLGISVLCFFRELIILAPRVLSQHSEMIQSELREDPGLGDDDLSPLCIYSIIYVFTVYFVDIAK